MISNEAMYKLPSGFYIMEKVQCEKYMIFLEEVFVIIGSRCLGLSGSVLFLSDQVGKGYSSSELD